MPAFSGEPVQHLLALFRLIGIVTSAQARKRAFFVPSQAVGFRHLGKLRGRGGGCGWRGDAAGPPEKRPPPRERGWSQDERNENCVSLGLGEGQRNAGG